MTFWQTIITTLLFTSISALTFIAYKHPNGYMKVYKVITFALATIFLFYVIYDLGYMSGHHNTVMGIHDLNENMVKTPDLNRISSFTIILVYASAYAYLWFLTKLPEVLEMGEDAKDEKPKEKTDDE